jgi:hypothetical protein
MLRGVPPKSRYSQSAALTLLFALALAPTFACSDDKPKSQQSTGDESTFDHAKDGVNQAHENFKQGIQPTAGWVDDRSHEVADEAVSAPDKTKKKLSGDGDHDHDHDSK